MKLLICDLDGTIIDTAEDMATSVNETLVEYNSNVTPKEVRGMIGNGIEKLMERALIKCNAEQFDLRSLVSEFRSIYLKNICIATRFYDGVADTLKYAESKGLRIVIATMKPKEHTRALLQALGAQDMFDEVLCKDDMLRAKPDPWCVNYFAEKFGVDTSEIIYVGDSLNDTQTALSAGVSCVAVTYGYCDAQAINSSGAHYIIDDFSKLKSII